MDHGFGVSQSVRLDPSYWKHFTSSSSTAATSYARHRPGSHSLDEVSSIAVVIAVEEATGHTYTYVCAGAYVVGLYLVW